MYSYLSISVGALSRAAIQQQHQAGVAYSRLLSVIAMLRQSIFHEWVKKSLDERKGKRKERDLPRFRSYPEFHFLAAKNHQLSFLNNAFRVCHQPAFAGVILQ